MMQLTKQKFDACMIDLETYGTHAFCPVWAITLAFFNYSDYDTYVVSYLPSVNYQRNTLKMLPDYEWWQEIDPDASKRKAIRESLITDSNEQYIIEGSARGLHLSFYTFARHMEAVIYSRIKQRIFEDKCGYLYGNGVDFDKVHLEQLFSSIKKDAPYPWHYRDWIDVPTLIAAAKMKTGIDYKQHYKENVQHATHNPILDCKDQIVYTKQALTALGAI